MAMPVNMILVMYVILCILSYDFNKLTMLYIHVHIYISLTIKSGLTFFLSKKYLSVCLSVCLSVLNRQRHSPTLGGPFSEVPLSCISAYGMYGL